MLLLTVVRRKQRRKTSQSSSKRAYAVGWGRRPRHALKESPSSGSLPQFASAWSELASRCFRGAARVGFLRRGLCWPEKKQKHRELGRRLLEKTVGRGDVRLQRREKGKREDVRELGVQNQTNCLLLWFGFGFKNKIKSCIWRKQNIFGSNQLKTNRNLVFSNSYQKK